MYIHTLADGGFLVGNYEALNLEDRGHIFPVDQFAERG
jgi:hypothetical protein